MRLVTATLVVVVAAAMLVSAQVDCQPVIKQSDGKNYQYNLTALCHASGEIDIFTTRDEQGNYYFINFCGPTSAACTTGSTVCMRDPYFNNFGCGMLDTQKWADSPSVKPGEGLQVTYENGEECSTDGAKRSSVITLQCDPNEPEGIIDTVEVKDCHYTFTFRSAHACGKPASGGGGGSGGAGETAALVILIILLVAVAVYFAAGAVYQKKVKGAQAPREYVIHSDFWCALPGMVVDGCKFIAHGCKKGDYVQV